jgi:hypothetical protein
MVLIHFLLAGRPTLRIFYQHTYVISAYVLYICVYVYAYTVTYHVLYKPCLCVCVFEKFKNRFLTLHFSYFRIPLRYRFY